MENFIYYIATMMVVAFIQNMMFTWSSRSRNSGNPGYHRKAAWGSNGVWFLCQVFIMKQLMPVLMAAELTNEGIARLLVTAVAYVIATSEGSVLMMKIMLKREKGSHKVGAAAEDNTPKTDSTKEAATCHNGWGSVGARHDEEIRAMFATPATLQMPAKLTLPPRRVQPPPMPISSESDEFHILRVGTKNVGFYDVNELFMAKIATLPQYASIVAADAYCG